MQNSVDLNVNEPDWMESHVINADLDISWPFVVHVKRIAGWMKMRSASVVKARKHQQESVSTALEIKDLKEKSVSVVKAR